LSQVEHLVVTTQAVVEVLVVFALLLILQLLLVRH
jgi:hypothetical protein